jgi:16S rRNA (adenine(1408)-N(1))-methyltransferase
LIAPYQGRIVIDIGTGDGFYVWNSARKNPDQFYIGIDSNHFNLERISEKICRKPSKGGAPNALFVQASIEDLPLELEGLAQRVQIQFPWGSLLKALVLGEIQTLVKLRKICREEAQLSMIMSLDPLRDRSEIERLKLPALTLEYITSALIPCYEKAGFEIVESGLLPAEMYLDLKSTWGKRLRRMEQQPIYFLGRAAKQGPTP